MTDEPLIPPYLLAQRQEIPVVDTHLCTCVSDQPGGPAGAYTADPDCDECEGIGVLIPPDVTPEGEVLHAEPLPFDHPALANEQWSPTFGAGNRKT